MKNTRIVFTVFCLFFVLACSSQPGSDNYYSLVLAGDEPFLLGAETEITTRLIVGPIQLPAYLSQRGLPIQLGASQVQNANHHFWAEPLDEAIAKVLVRDLSRFNDSLVVDRDAGRWTVSGDCRLRVEFDKFHATTESRVVSSGRYWISSSQSSLKQEFELFRSLSEDGYAKSVEALRNILETLAREISVAINSGPYCSKE